MDGIRREIRELITVNEKIQSALAQGEQLSTDESAIVRMCGNELLAAVNGARGHISHGDSKDSHLSAS